LRRLGVREHVATCLQFTDQASRGLVQISRVAASQPRSIERYVSV
jgi:hypothetical protein